MLLFGPLLCRSLAKFTPNIFRTTTVLHVHTTCNTFKEVVPHSTPDWTTVYKFNKSNRNKIIAGLTLITGGISIGLMTFVGLQTFGLFPTSQYITRLLIRISIYSLLGFVVLVGASRLGRRAIGALSLSGDQKLVKADLVDFWSRDYSIIIPLDMIVPWAHCENPIRMKWEKAMDLKTYDGLKLFISLKDFDVVRHDLLFGIFGDSLTIRSILPKEFFEEIQGNDESPFNMFKPFMKM